MLASFIQLEIKITQKKPVAQWCGPIVRFTAAKFAGEGRMPACVEQDFPVKGKAYRKLSAQEWSQVRSITVERHFALNWLCGFAPANDWDKTPTDT